MWCRTPIALAIESHEQGNKWILYIDSTTWRLFVWQYNIVWFMLHALNLQLLCFSDCLFIVCVFYPLWQWESACGCNRLELITSTIILLKLKKMEEKCYTILIGRAYFLQGNGSVYRGTAWSHKLNSLNIRTVFILIFIGRCVYYNTVVQWIPPFQIIFNLLHTVFQEKQSFV